jgi:hypothetical protein
MSYTPPVSDASSTKKGLIQLTGDLSGTAASPTVPDLANKASATTTISAGTGLSGGGNLTANRTLSVSYGTTAGTAAQGNDSRITGALQESTVTTKGDILAATGPAAIARVGVGTNGQFLMADSSQAAGVRWGSAGSSSGSITEVVVAANDAPTAVKNNADYVCDGTADQVEINAAIDQAFQTAAAGPRGGVVLVGQYFNINAPIIMKAALTLHGLGAGTIIRSMSMATGTAMIELADKNHHMTTVRDLTLYGNYATGGGSHGIHYLQSDVGGDGNTSTYNPPSNPDACHRFINLFIKAFTTGTRHGVYMDDNVRGAIFMNSRISDCSGTGFNITGSSDGKYSQCTAIGTGIGWSVGGASNQFVNCKSAYSVAAGWNLTSSRSQLVGCHAQDSGTVGYSINGSDAALTGCVADSNSRLSTTAYAVEVSAANAVIEGIHVYDRNQTPSSRQNRGIDFTGATDLFLTGSVRIPSGTDFTNGAPTGYVRLWRVGNTPQLYAVS